MGAFGFALVAGCNLVSGVDGFQFHASGGATSATSSTGKGTGSTTTSGTSTSSSVATTTTSTGSGCSGMTMLCGSMCVYTPTDPNHCGNCQMQCGSSEWCSGSNCVCRPGLVNMGGACVDPKTNPNNCGGAVCMGTQVCQNGTCVGMCTAPLVACSGGCTNTMTDPQHCGLCTKACDAGQVCGAGICLDYRPAAGCTQCPCQACSGDFARCCPYPGATTPICVTSDAGACP